MLLILISSAVLIAGIGGCQMDLMQDQAFLDCNMGFLSFASNLASDPLSICGEEAKAALACIFDFQKQCPELIETYGGVTQQMLDSTCAMIPGPCAAATSCIQTSMPSGDGSDMAPPSSLMPHMNVPFVMVPYVVQMICGQLKDFTMCVESAEGQCPNLDDMLKNITDAILMGFREHFTNFPTGDQIKAIIKNDCPTVHADFATSSCLEQKLGSHTYLNCVKAAKGDSTGSVLSCEAYDAVTMCLKTALVPKCGQDHYDTMLRFSRFCVKGKPMYCPTGAATTTHVSLPIGKPTDSPTGTATTIHVSLLTLVLVAVTLLLS